MNNIILIGFMGSGKSSFGRFLGRKGYRFTDTDDMIVEREHTSINDIFTAHGEEYFRDLETKVITELVESGERGLVVSVGGGLPLRECNRELLRRLGKVIYLRADIKTLINRLSGDSVRPLLKGGNLTDRISTLMRERKSIYEDAADIILDTDNKSFDRMYNEIRKALK